MADQIEKNLEAHQAEITALTQATEKVELELANKRNELMVPIYEKRRAVIDKIDNFWTSVFMNNMTLTQVIEPTDIPALEHLTNLWVKWDPKEARSYDITFTFSENPYFSNKELVKKVTFKGEDQTTTPTEIKWKEGKDLTLKDTKRKKGEDNMSDSFFSIFQDDDVTLLDYIANELFAEALHIYANGGEDDDDFSDDGSVDLDDEDDEEDEELPPKKKGKN